MIFERLPGIKGLIIDMDGVLWRDNEPIGDLAAIFNYLHERNLRFILATNNATRTIEEYQEKLVKFGIVVSKKQVINSAEATGIYLQERYPNGANVFVVGESGLKKTLTAYNFNVQDNSTSGVDVVVASLDFHLTYEKLTQASLLVQSGCAFIGTNTDRSLPTPKGLIPGSGVVVGAIEIASGKKAKIIGKPEPLLYQMALKQLDLEPGETLAIGDRLETDIAGAQAAGIHTALVLTGASTRKQAQEYSSPPELIAKDLTELVF